MLALAFGQPAGHDPKEPAGLVLASASRDRLIHLYSEATDFGIAGTWCVLVRLLRMLVFVGVCLCLLVFVFVVLVLFLVPTCDPSSSV